MKQFHLAVCGGTFDHFHSGHKAFLRFALSKTEHLLIGVTSDMYAEKKSYASSIESYEKRYEALKIFLQQENRFAHTTISPIENVYGPVEWQQRPIEAILVTQETRAGAILINEKRQSNQQAPFKTVVHNLLRAEDGNVISSVRIRKGEINRNGRLFINPLWRQKTLKLPDSLREKLRKPFGNVINDFTTWVSKNRVNASESITVGDVVTKSFHDLGILQKIAIVDFVVQREKIYADIKDLGFTGNEHVETITNPPGSISQKLIPKIQKAFFHQTETQSVIRIVGEEDLAVLPVLLIAPLGYSIFYGQPNEGVVQVEVTEETKEMAYTFLRQFSAQPNTRGH